MKSSILKELQRIELAIRGIDPLADIAELEAAQSDMQALIVALQAEDSSLQAQISGNDSDISALQALGGGGGIEGYIYAADVKAQGTSGGTFTAGAWRTRTLNTLNTSLAGVTLASNVVSGVPAGEYMVFGRAPAYRVARHVASLVTSQGSFTYSAGVCVENVQDASFILRRVNFTSSATVQVHHRCDQSLATFGFGVESGFALEVYTELLMIKIG